nr:unnamed protein product [Callosobruchus analis]
MKSQSAANEHTITPKNKWNTDEANWNLYHHYFDNFFINCPPAFQNTDEKYQFFIQGINDAALKSIPYYKPFMKKNSVPAPSWDQECEEAINNRKREFLKYKQQSNVENYVSRKREIAKTKIVLKNKTKDKEREQKLENALEAVTKGMSKKAAAKRFGIPRSTIQYRLSDKFKSPGYGPPTVLTSKEEEILIKKGFPRRIDDVQASVQQLIKKDKRETPFKDGRPGKGWYKAFLRRHPEIVERTTEAVTAASAPISEKDIRKWFDFIESYLIEENYRQILNDASRVYNGDETNFLLCPKNKKVLAPKDMSGTDIGQDKSTGEYADTDWLSKSQKTTTIEEYTRQAVTEWLLQKQDSLEKLHLCINIKNVAYQALVEKCNGIWTNLFSSSYLRQISYGVIQ